MNGRPLGLRLTRRLARALLCVYPRAFRRRWSHEFVELAADRWRRERRTTRVGGLATVRAGLLLCADTLRSAPGQWRTSGRRGKDRDRDPQRSLREVVASWLAGSLSDLRMALRLMRRQPAASLLALATLALGIGVSTAAFGALDRVVLSPLPFEHGDRMRYLAIQHRTLGWRITPDAAVLAQWRQRATTIERIETYHDDVAIRIDTGVPERLNVLVISPGLAGMLGVRPLTGRMLVEADGAPDAPAAVMVHETFWRRNLGGDPSIVGRSLRFTTGPATVVGIWPASARVYQRVSSDLVRMTPRDQEIEEGSWTSLLGVLRDGIPDGAAAREIDDLFKSVSPRSKDLQAAILPPAGFVSDAYVQGLWLVFVAAAMLLVVAVINAANLLLGRASTRGAELGVRLALGGSQTRILRLFAAESVMLALASVAAGFGVAWLMSAVYSAWEPRGLAADRGGWFDVRTAVFAAAAAGIATLAGTLLPAWRARTATVREVLAGAGGQRSTDASSRLRAVLIAAQAAIAVLLVAGASITGRSFLRLASTDPGFEVDRLAMVSVAAPQARYTTPDAQNAFLRQVREAIASLPQVQQITVTNAPPFSTSTTASVPFFEGEPEPSAPAGNAVRAQSIDPAYFAVFGTPIVAGRQFDVSDGRDAVIVNESFARAHGGNVIGRRLKFTGRDARWFTVVGVAGDITAGPLVDGAVREPQLYFPGEAGGERQFARFVLRVTGDPDAVIRDVRARVASIDPMVPLSEASAVREIFDRQTARHRFVALLLGGLAVFGVVFAVSGVYGMVTLEVARRRREVGLRVALGATAGRVVRHLVRRGLRPVLAGAGAGVVAAAALGPYLKELLFRVSARDPWSAAIGVAVVVGAAACACALPARRAARVDPAITLRAD